jgi:uncharacterized membrane protein
MTPRLAALAWPRVVALAWITSLGCGVDTAPSTCGPDDPTTASWTSFGRGFTLERCQGCHAGSAPDRQGAPPDVTFDTEDTTRAVATRIHRAVIVDGTMPPGGGVSDDDLTLVAAWLRCDFGLQR